MTPRVLIKKLRPDATVPRYMTAGAAGMDLCAALDAPVTIAPGARVPISTGLAMAIAPGFEGQVRPRSGLAREHGITCANSPGTIDHDYRGTVVVTLINLGSAPVTIEPGHRIAQLVIAPVVQAELVEVDELPATARGAGGFGIDRAMSTRDDDEGKTDIYDSSVGRRAKSSTRRGHHQGVEQPTPTDIDPLPPVPSVVSRDRSEPLRVISMKAPAGDDDKRAAKQHRVQLRSMDDVHKRTPPGGMGFFAPPRDPREVRARRVRDYLIWGSVVVIVGSAVMIAVWLVAGG